MAMADGSSSLPTSSAYGGGGGVGGKFQKRAFSRSRPTPYNRPLLTAHRESNWISKLVLDPASKLVAASARRFFSPFFRKRLPTSSTPPLLPPPPVENPELSNGLQDSRLPKHTEPVQTAATANSQNLIISEGSCGISEFEQLLKQKTFTRHEIDRLTELLQSKAVDLPVTNDVRKAESSALKPVKLKDFLVGNMREREGSHGIDSTPGTSAKAVEEDIMPRAEFVKAYVGSRPTKESSMLSFHGQAIRENRNLLSNLPSSPKSSALSLERMATGRVSVQGNCFPTPRSRGRSAIFRMARAPYLLMHQTPDKASECNGNLLDSPTLPKLDDRLGWKEPGRKRSSAVLDDVGSTRRIRGMRDLVSHEVALPFSGKNVPDGVQQCLSSTKFSFKDNGNYSAAKPAGGVEDTDIASTSYCHVPPKSRETASRLLRNVEKTAENEKSAESKRIVDGERSPSKLTTMPSGQDLKSRQSADSSKLLQGAQNGENLEDLSCRSLTGIGNFNSQKQKRAEENGPREPDLQPHLTRVVDSDTVVSTEHKLPKSVPSDLSTVPLAQFAEKKYAFMMSVCEDFFDLDEEDTYCNRPAAESSVEERGEQKTVATESDPSSSILDKPPAFFETRKTRVEPVTVSENSPAIIDGGCATSFAFPALSLPGKSLQSGVHPPSSSLDKPNYVESSFASDSEVSTPKFSSWTQPIPSSSNRSGGTGNLSLEVPGSEHVDVDLQESVKGNGKPKTQISVAFTSSISSSTSSPFLPNPSNIKNGPSAILPSPFGNQASVDAHSFIAPASVSSTVATPADTSATTSVAASLLSPFVSPSGTHSSTGNSLFKFGSHDSSTGKSQFQGTGSESMLSRLPSESGSVVATVSQSILSSSSTSSLIGTSAVVTSSTGNTTPFSSSTPATNLFGSSSSSGLSNLTSSSKFKLDNFGSGLSSSIFSTVSTASSGANAVSSVNGSIPTVFDFGAGSSGTAPVISTVNSTSSVTPSMLSHVGTASSSMSTPTSVATFGISSSSETNVASSSGTTSTLFGSGWQTPNPPSFGSTFNLSPSNGFSPFGASSTNTAPSTTMVFGETNATTSPGPVSSFATLSSSPSPFPTQTTFTNFPPTFMGNGNHNQMNAEDSMAEDPVQQSPFGGAHVFGQQSSLTSPPPGFAFGSMAQPAAAPVFQLGGQHNQSPMQSNPLQGPGSFDGGNFSLGSAGGEDKSVRRFVKVNKSRHRKK